MAGQIKEKPKGYPPLVAITESCRGWRSAKGVVNFLARGPRPTWLLSRRGRGGVKTKEHFRRQSRTSSLRPSFHFVRGRNSNAFFFPSSRNSANNSSVKRTKAVVEHARSLFRRHCEEGNYNALEKRMLSKDAIFNTFNPGAGS